MPSPRIRAADIAKLAGVSRAAVHQWRKKFPEFPLPVEGADSPSPLFDLAQVERWLTKTGRMPERSADKTASSADEVATRLRATSSEEEVVGAYLAAEHLARAVAEDTVRIGIAAGLDRPLHRQDGAFVTGFAGVDPERIVQWVREVLEDHPRLRPALEPLVEQSDQRISDLQKQASALDTRFGSYWRTEELESILERSRIGWHSRPKEYTRFLVDLAGIERGVLLDPCTGRAGTLIEAGRQHPDLQLIGVEADPGLATIAQQRAILHDLDIDLRIGDSISSDDPAVGVVADAVISTPPHRDATAAMMSDRDNPRWVFGRPGRDTVEWWLQQAVEHLSVDGRAIVCTGRHSAEGRQTALLRHELLRRGSVEAVISIETGRSGVGTWVWVLARPGRTVDPDRVLMLHVPRSRFSPDSFCFDEMVGIYRRWRADGEFTASGGGAVVPVRELLDPDAALVPQMWIARAAAASPSALVEAIGAADAHRSAVTAAAAPQSLAPLIPVGSPVRTEKLSALGGVEILRGTVRPSGRGTVSTSVPARILSHQALVALDQGVSLDEAAPLADRFDNPDPVRTQAGDIFIGAAGGLGEPDAVTVLDVDGWALNIHSYLVRADSTVVDRWFLVACIRAALRQPWIHKMTRVRDNIGRIAIPVLPLADQQKIGRAVRQLDREQKALEHQMQATRQLCEAVEGAVATGAITVRAPEVKRRGAPLKEKQSAPARKKRVRRPLPDAGD